MKVRTTGAFHGMVATGHPLATTEGLAVLRAGGNATDAAIAAAAVLAVVSPQECGLGGDLMGLFHRPGDSAPMALNASGYAPASATLARYQTGIPMSGGASVSVPGMVAGWAAAAQRYGTLPLERLLEPAIALAEDGFAANDVLIENSIAKQQAILADVHCAATFYPGGRPLKMGERVVQAATARTLRAIGREGADAFYQGAIAEAIAGYVQSHGGGISVADMAGYEPLWQDVIEAPFHGYRVCTMPPNSWAPALLVQLLEMERETVASSAGDPAAFYLQGIRTRRTAYAALASAIADPAVAGERARDVVRTLIESPSRARRNGASDMAPCGTDTSNVAVVDSQGHAVSLLQSVFVPFGSGLYEPETGTLLNNRMRGFSLSADHPNVIGPLKRPAQTLTPVLVLEGDAVHMACSTPGGPGQTGGVAQFLARVLANEEPLPDAMSAPRWSMTLTGDFILEDTAPESLRAAIQAAEPGVKTMPWGSVNFGSMVVIRRQGEGWQACADLRRHASVAGY